MTPAYYPSEPMGPYKPLSPWAYYGYGLLFSIPLVGLIFLIIFSFSDENINRRNFARSYWIALLIGIVVSAIAIAIAIPVIRELMDYILYYM